ncbi:MAG: YjbH domain-containing protein [Nitrospirota bacterium]
MEAVRWGLIVIMITGILTKSASLSFASDNFKHPAYWGGTGLMEIPTARVIDDWDVRAGVGQSHPYRYYFGTLGFLPGLELNGRITEFLGFKATGAKWAGYGNDKDKAVDIKYQILNESRPLPAIAIGAQDIQGTRLFNSEYITFSRQIYPFDLTVGYGRGRLKGLFYGAEFKASDSVSFLIEKNPIKYEKDIKRVVERAKSEINIGTRIRISKGLVLNLSYQRGEKLGALLSYTFGLGKPMLPWKPDYPFTGPVDRRSLREVIPSDPAERIERYLLRQGFANVKVKLTDKEIFVEYENTRYLSEAKALGRVLRTVVSQAPKDIENIHAITKVRNIPTIATSAKPQEIIDFFNNKITTEEFKDVIKVSTEIPEIKDFPLAATELKRGSFERLTKGAWPGLQTYWNDPSGFFKYRLTMDAWSTVNLWDGADIFGIVRLPVSNTISTNQPPISKDPVRSDIVDYIGRENLRLDAVVLNQLIRFGDRTLARGSFGYLENEYAGISGEILHLLGEGRFAVGAEVTSVKKRDPVDTFRLKDTSYSTATLNTLYRIPGLDLTAAARAGRFLAGDDGVRFDIARTKRGVTVGFWYSVTDMKDYVGGKRYHDKGFSITIPANMFFDHDSKKKYTYALSPWTRDTGQLVSQWRTLGSYMFNLYPADIKGRLDEMKD